MIPSWDPDVHVVGSWARQHLVEKSVAFRATRKRVAGMWVKVYLPTVRCSPGLWEEWAGLLQAALFS